MKYLKREYLAPEVEVVIMQTETALLVVSKPDSYPNGGEGFGW